MSNEGEVPNLIDNPAETNVHNEWQGSLRRGLLDLDMINYALRCDRNHTHGCSRSLMITCLDQIDGDIAYLHNGVVKRAEQERVMEMANDVEIAPERVLLSYAEDSGGVVEYQVPFFTPHEEWAAPDGASHHQECQ
jgi:adenylosuccinate synthase